MSARKSERLMNLVIALLVTPHYLSKDRIRQVVDGYRGQTDEAFDRMFERDKDDLRDIGVQIELGTFERGFGDDLGYRIVRDEFEMPELVLEPDEAAVLGLAARVWQHARLASQTSSALLKLRAAGLEVDPDALSTLDPRLAASEAAFEPLWDAVVTRTPVEFSYRRPGAEASSRAVEPWSVLSWHGHWYLAAHDRGRGEPRMFRVSRIDGAVSAAGSPGEYDIPADIDVKAMAMSLFPPPPSAAASVRVRAGTALALRRRATRSRPADAGWDEIDVPYGSISELAAEIASFGADAVATAPPELRDRVVAHLRGILEPAVGS